MPMLYAVPIFNELANNFSPKSTLATLIQVSSWEASRVPSFEAKPDIGYATGLVYFVEKYTRPVLHIMSGITSNWGRQHFTDTIIRSNNSGRGIRENEIG